MGQFSSFIFTCFFFCSLCYAHTVDQFTCEASIELKGHKATVSKVFFTPRLHDWHGIKFQPEVPGKKVIFESSYVDLIQFGFEDLSGYLQLGLRFFFYYEEEDNTYVLKKQRSQVECASFHEDHGQGRCEITHNYDYSFYDVFGETSHYWLDVKDGQFNKDAENLKHQSSFFETAIKVDCTHDFTKTYYRR